MKRPRLPKVVRNRTPFLETERLLLSLWQYDDEFNAYALFGNPIIASYYAERIFTNKQINMIVKEEQSSFRRHNFCLFPVFTKEKRAFVGVCGIRIFKEQYQFVIIFMPHQWHKGYGQEAAKAIIDYAFYQLHIPSLIACRSVDDKFSEYVYHQMGFIQIRNCFRTPNDRPYNAYLLTKEDYEKNQE